jgi:hypothetical protein
MQLPTCACGREINEHRSYGPRKCDARTGNHNWCSCREFKDSNPDWPALLADVIVGLMN